MTQDNFSLLQIAYPYFYKSSEVYSDFIVQKTSRRIVAPHNSHWPTYSQWTRFSSQEQEQVVLVLIWLSSQVAKDGVLTRAALTSRWQASDLLANNRT